MIHLALLGLVLAIAWGSRHGSLVISTLWGERWSAALRRFLFAPFLLLMTALALLWMGPQGQMAGSGIGWLSYGLSLVLISMAVLSGLHLTWQGWQSLQWARSQPQHVVATHPTRILGTPALFAAQVGFWQPELVVSQGLLDTLSPKQLQAVLIHEQAHAHYRDTFWFFSLGWIRQLTGWLPQTEILWQELLTLRELRADRWAATQVDPLLLAEALVQVVSHQSMGSVEMPAGFASLLTPSETHSRLHQRVNALLLLPSEPVSEQASGSWLWVSLACLPLLAIPFHF